MHTDSSASLTYFASVSASECTTTVRMPISRQARWMRSAISPRLAMRIFSNTLAEDEEGLAVLDRLPVLDQDRLDDAGGVGVDLVHQLHRLDDADDVALLHRMADFDERLRVRRGGAVEGAHHGRLDDMAFDGCGGFAGRRGGCLRGGVRPRGCGSRVRSGHHHARGRDYAAFDDLDLLLALGDLELGDAGFL